MNKIRLILTAILLIVTGCSAPDDPNWKTLEDGIDDLPPKAELDAKRWAANRDAADHFDVQNQDEDVFIVRCWPKGAIENDKLNFKDLGAIKVKEVLACLNRFDVPTYEECIIRIVGLASGAMTAMGGGQNYDCRPLFMPRYKHVASETEPDVPDNWTPRKVRTPQVAKDLVAAPKIPFWLIGVITIGVGGVIVVTGGGGAAFLPALCILSEGGPACPSNPSYPFGDTPQPGGGT